VCFFCTLRSYWNGATVSKQRENLPVQVSVLLRSIGMIHQPPAILTPEQPFLYVHKNTVRALELYNNNNNNNDDDDNNNNNNNRAFWFTHNVTYNPVVLFFLTSICNVTKTKHCVLVLPWGFALFLISCSFMFYSVSCVRILAARSAIVFSFVSLSKRNRSKQHRVIAPRRFERCSSLIFKGR
jgi:hypothetical protein